MVFIRAGSFMMGSDKFYPEEKPVHKVTVHGFWMDKYLGLIKRLVNLYRQLIMRRLQKDH